MEVRLFALLLTFVLFVAAFGFWSASWVLRDRPVSLTAFYYAAVFGFGAVLSLILWRVTFS